MSLQWKRKAQVIVGGGGNGITVTDLRIQFEVTKTIQKAPNTAIIKIFNLHPDNERRIKNEFDEIILNAGYVDSQSLVFRGNIKHVFHYRQTNDLITQIQAADGDQDYRSATLNVALASGSSLRQLIEQAVGSFKDTVAGYIGIKDSNRIRGRTLSGSTRSILDSIARDQAASWSIQDGQLTIVGSNAVLPGTAIVVNATTGMLSTPEVNDKGIRVKCLLNTQIKISGALKLDNNNIMLRVHQQKSIGPNIKKLFRNLNPQHLDPDGIYKVIFLQHSGDTRGTGTDWYTESTCVGLSQPIPVESTAPPESDVIGELG